MPVISSSSPSSLYPLSAQSTLSIIWFPGRDWLNNWLDKYIGYVHHGDLRYLIHSNLGSVGGYKDIKLLSNPSIINRAWWWLGEVIGDFKAPIKDHSIGLYCQKLAAFAHKRSAI